MKYLKHLFIVISALIILTFMVIVVNQTATVVDLVSRLSPLAGSAVLWGLVIVYTVLILVPIMLFFRLPTPLIPPDAEDEAACKHHLACVRKRLAKNTSVSGMDLRDRKSIENALAVIGKEADKTGVKHAKYVFVSTAISQNGRLDALAVFVIQTRLIWEIARLYSQRPTLRDMLNLYANVAGTVFFAAEFEDINISEQLEPLLASVMGSAAGVVPGAQAVASIVAESALTGAANAFLTLRVAMITKRYSSALVQEKRGKLNRSASLEAAALLGTFIKEAVSEIGGAVIKASGHAVAGVVKGAVSKVGGVMAAAIPKRKHATSDTREDQMHQ
jgi:Domain of unknown function (DUF697)